MYEEPDQNESSESSVEEEECQEKSEKVERREKVLDIIKEWILTTPAAADSISDETRLKPCSDE